MASFTSVVSQIEVQPRPLFVRAAKRALDIAGSAIGLAVLSPAMVAVGGLIRLTSNGPAVFAQERVGLGGKKFTFYKFRSMVEDAEDRKEAVAHLNIVNGAAFKIPGDPRITRLGAVLRKYSIDELPQLWNVLRGEMSLVGPRPPCVDEVERYTHREVQRLSVPPGVTGLWQVSGRSDIQDFERWIDLDLEYASKWNIALDLKILWRTVGAVISARGAE